MYFGNALLRDVGRQSLIRDRPEPKWRPYINVLRVTRLYRVADLGGSRGASEPPFES